MGPGSDGAPTATAAADAFEHSANEQRLATLRWVWPFENQVTVLSANPALLGRDAGAATQLDTPQVSRRHAEVRVEKPPVATVAKEWQSASKNSMPPIHISIAMHATVSRT